MRCAITVLAAVGAAGSWYFVLAYWYITGGGWRHNPGGRHLMTFTANLAALFSLIVLNRLWDYPGRPGLTLALFAALVGQIFWRCVLLHRAQR